MSDLGCISGYPYASAVDDVLEFLDLLTLDLVLDSEEGAVARYEDMVQEGKKNGRNTEEYMEYEEYLSEDANELKLWKKAAPNSPQRNNM